MRPNERRCACPLNCFDSCSLLLSVEGGRITGVRGDPDHPITRGFACPKARLQVERLSSPRRLLTPLVRRGGGLVPATWDEALDLVAGKLKDAVVRLGPESILHYHDSGGTGALKDLGRRFFALFGGVTNVSGSLCWSAGLAAHTDDFGGVLAHAPHDVESARLIIIWGRNPWHTNPHLLPFLASARARGARLVVIDPLPTETARHADLHLAPRPGSDGLLAMAMAAVLIRGGKAAGDFLARRTSGFDGYARAALALRADEVSRETGVAEADWTALAEMYSAHHPAAILMGYGMQRHRHGGWSVRAIDALAAIAGNIGVSGGGVSYANSGAGLGVLPVTQLGEALEAGMGPGGASTGPLLTGARAGRKVPRALIATQLGLLADPPIAVSVIERANPAAQLPDAKEAARALAGVPFKVVLDLVLTDTGRLADVVLPCASGLEEEDFFAGYWHEYPMWSLGALSAPAGVQREREIWSGLARRLGLKGWVDRPAEAWIRDALSPLASHGIGASQRGSWFRNPLAQAVPWADGAFGTTDGLFHFPDGPIPELRGDLDAAEPARAGSCQFGGAMEAQAGAPGLLWLISPQHRLTLHSQFQDALRGAADGGGPGGGSCIGVGTGAGEDAGTGSGTVAGTDPCLSRRPAVHVSRRAASEAGVADGDSCRVTSARGELLAVVRCEPAPWRDDVAMIIGGGGLGGDGAFPSSANILTSAGLSDIGLGAVYYDCMVRINQCSEPRNKAGDKQD